MPKFKVAIVGAGLGGLTLAQALRRDCIEVEVFERDASLWDRPQGYRLHIDTDGAEALREALPADLYRLFRATSMEPLDFTTIVDTALNIRRGAQVTITARPVGIEPKTAASLTLTLTAAHCAKFCSPASKTSVISERGSPTTKAIRMG